ncbi:hypothetical protein LARI1_G007679 [Lachnellula arida]|uniref:Uncharacterized protein n=1 Tax=Lachnellula arida TaxID=1316785 RepID=A0A8T9B5X4_9HELO|nr:hypothetical protein LARI1_G007679 [Lachnellula arida]
MSSSKSYILTPLSTSKRRSNFALNLKKKKCYNKGKLREAIRIAKGKLTTAINKAIKDLYKKGV